jgi:hypothetical protein
VQSRIQEGGIMSHNVHEVQHQVEHELEHEKAHGGGEGGAKPPDSNNRKIALLISILALFLALSETLGKAVQTELISTNVLINDTWAFYQARVIRITILRTAAESLQVTGAGVADPAAKTARDKTLGDWKKTMEKYDSDPEKKEGRKELMEKARELEEKRDELNAKYHHFEVSSAAFQIGIVLSSAAVITGMMILAWIGSGLGIAGLVLTGIGLWAPEAVHLF